LPDERHRANYITGTTGNAGLMAFTRALGSESVDHGIRVVVHQSGTHRNRTPGRAFQGTGTEGLRRRIALA